MSSPRRSRSFSITASIVGTCSADFNHLAEVLARHVDAPLGRAVLGWPAIEASIEHTELAGSPSLPSGLSPPDAPASRWSVADDDPTSRSGTSR